MTELDYIHAALFDPYDQSLWFYHQDLLCCFDAELATQTMAPNLTEEERSEYLEHEISFVEEILEDTDDSKWPYLCLIECTRLKAKIALGYAGGETEKMRAWLQQVQRLDPLRMGRWTDLEQTLGL